MAEEIANQQDFRLPLALAADNYASLHQCLQEVHGAAGQFHAEWRAGGGGECVKAAQDLDIKSALLNGLYMIRVLHKDWLSSTPVTSPESLAHVLPLFRHALDLCENHSDAVEFPINGLQPALAHLQKQVGASLLSLEGGQWQATAEGQWYAQRHGMARARGEPDLQSWPALTRPTDALPPAFAGLAAQCRNLSLIVAQLQAVLAEGPASRQAGQRSFKAALGTGRPAAGSPAVVPRQPLTQPRVPVRGGRTSAPARIAHPRPPVAAARTDPPDPAIKTRAPRAPRHVPPRSEAVDPPLHGAAQALAARPMAGLVAPPEATTLEPPAVDPAEAARLQQEQVAALQADLDQLLAKAGRRDAPGPAGGTSGAAMELAWARHSREFDACEATRASAEALAARAGALSAPTRREPAVESLQQKIDAASRDALAGAAEAAQATLAGFAQACDKAIVHGDLKGAGVASYAELAQHCRDLQAQWRMASLRPRMPKLEMRMALYSAYETACATLGNKPDSTAGALTMAGHLDHAARIAQRISGGAQRDLAETLRAFPKFCVQQRNELLRVAAHMQVDAIDATRAESIAALSPVLLRSLDVTAAYDVLLIGNRLGDPLPDDWDHAPAKPSSSASSDPARASSAGPGDDLSLAETAREVAERARHQYQGAIELPADAPELAAKKLQAGLALLRQTELTARTAAATIGRFHELSAALESARPDDRRAIVQRHLSDMRQLAAELRQAPQALDDVARPSLALEVRDRLNQSKVQLGADLRLAERMEVSLTTLDTLLYLRGAANRTRRKIKQGKETHLMSREVSGESHSSLIDKLGKDMARLTQHLPDEHNATEAESESLDTHASRLKAKIKCDKELILGKLLLDWGTKALLRKQGAGKPLDPERFKPLRSLIEKQPNVLAKTNHALFRHPLSSEHYDRYRAQIDINMGIQKELKELLEKLDIKLASGNTSGTAAGDSSNAQASVAQHLGIPAKGKPSRPSRSRHR